MPPSAATPEMPTPGAAAMSAVQLAAPAKPKLRGVSHQIAAFAALPAAVALVLRARTGTAALGALVYGASLVLLFSVSATYHRMHWPIAARRIIARVDHSAIFVLIAGTYTPFCLLLGPGTGHRLLAIVWAGAAVGIAIVIWLTGTPKPVRAAIYVLLGWFIVPVAGALRAAMGDHALMLLFGGGFFYTVGAVIYALRRPDPFPRVFGFHEIFHLLVVAAAACHFVVVDAALRAIR
ncbi:PAQR family membrane homeostasis protein TrhA [Anaeromyxobacter oryzae]|uniref:UPF0073 membrane protein n=1 Tax=Anaeromyxobacter oryzae TaxID=2918170 RepID=A0ABM7X181_9BACT|nr:hemolysin III family protein [Anaeromyxobacter oryzae]BDG05515.1 UPF0073 membrane protein [Anaeromyxobacter oryzae]